MSKREEFKAALKDAMKSKDQVALATVRLILSSLKDKDVAARGKGQEDGISEAEILAMLQTMIKQRNESIKTYQQAGREQTAHHYSVTNVAEIPAASSLSLASSAEA